MPNAAHGMKRSYLLVSPVSITTNLSYFPSVYHVPSPDLACDVSSVTTHSSTSQWAEIDDVLTWRFGFIIDRLSVAAKEGGNEEKIRPSLRQQELGGISSEAQKNGGICRSHICSGTAEGYKETGSCDLKANELPNYFRVKLFWSLQVLN